MLRSGIYIGWTGFGNLGDEAMLEICRTRFPQIHWSGFYRHLYQPNPPQFFRRASRDYKHLLRVLAEEFLHQHHLRSLGAQSIHKFLARLGGEVGMFGGGTLLNHFDFNYDAYTRVRKRTRNPVPVFGSGVADPAFWLGKPGWKDRRKDWVAVLNELPVVGVRGPHSKALLDEAGARNVVVSGDPAVAFHARSSEKLRAARTDGPLRIAVNTGECSGNLWGDMENIQESLAKTVMWLRDNKHEIEIIPIWPEDFPACEDLAKRAGLEQSHVSPVYSSPSRFLKKVWTFDLMLSLKLHSAILAAAADVPFLLLEYQPKCSDFAASVGWEQFCLRTSELNATCIMDRVSLLIERLPDWRSKLQARMSTLSNSFEEYCQKIESLLLGKAGSARGQAVERKFDS
jgi:hypothetical protein